MPFTLKTAQYIYTTISNSLTPVRKIYFYKTLTSCHNCQSKLLQLSIYFYNCQSIFNNCQSSSCSSFTLPFLASDSCQKIYSLQICTQFSLPSLEGAKYIYKPPNFGSNWSGHRLLSTLISTIFYLSPC